MVVTCFPAARDTEVLQERTGRPSRCTVQAPHCATPQPYFVPVRPRCSRRTQSRGVEGSTSTLTLRLFTVREITVVNLHISGGFQVEPAPEKNLSVPAHQLACTHISSNIRLLASRARVPAGTATGGGVAPSRKRKRSRLPGPRRFLRGLRSQPDCGSMA